MWKQDLIPLFTSTVWPKGLNLLCDGCFVPQITTKPTSWSFCSLIILRYRFSWVLKNWWLLCVKHWSQSRTFLTFWRCYISVSNKWKLNCSYCRKNGSKNEMIFTLVTPIMYIFLRLWLLLLEEIQLSKLHVYYKRLVSLFEGSLVSILSQFRLSVHYWLKKL